MVKAESIAKRLLNLEKYLSILSTLQKYNFNDFIANPLVYGSSERFLHLSIEALMDIGNHVVSDLNLGTVNWSSDIPALLREHGYLDDRQTDVFVKMIGFRNTLVHEYIEIDRAIVYDILHNHLEEIRDLMKAFTKFV
jgi:uncharacterized protein YutE (UPF0331/DUF86 family)